MAPPGCHSRAATTSRFAALTPMRSYAGCTSTTCHTFFQVHARGAANGVADPILGSPEPGKRPGSGRVGVVLGGQEVRGENVGGALHKRLRQRGGETLLAARPTEPDGAVSPSRA